MKFSLLRPTKDWENITFLGIDFFSYKETNKRRKVFYNSFYLLIDLFWYRMGFEFQYNLKRNKDYKEHRK